MPKLYEISHNIAKLYDMATDGDIDTQAFDDTLESLTYDFQDKAEDIACVIKSIDGDISAMDNERKGLETRQRALKNKRDRIYEYLFTEMQRADITLYKGIRAALAIKNNPPSLKIADEGAFKEWAAKSNPEFLKVVETVDIKKDIVKQAISSGQAVPYATVQQGKRLEIK